MNIVILPAGPEYEPEARRGRPERIWARAGSELGLLASLLGRSEGALHGAPGGVGMVLEPLRLALGVTRPLRGDGIRREDGVDGTGRQARVAVDALLRV